MAKYNRLSARPLQELDWRGDLTMNASISPAPWSNFTLPCDRTILAEFQRRGCVILPRALPAAVVRSWHSRAMELMDSARTITRREGAHELVYRVVTGEVIRAKWPEMMDFYQDERTLAWVKQMTGENGIATSGKILSAVNLNILDSERAVYRWHFDAVAYTMLLYLTDTNPEDGAALEFVPACPPHQIPDLRAAHIVRHLPMAGTLVLMDGTRCYHRVAPMLRSGLRLSVPLVYPRAGVEDRPTGLDSYLYEQAS